MPTIMISLFTINQTLTLCIMCVSEGEVHMIRLVHISLQYTIYAVAAHILNGLFEAPKGFFRAPNCLGTR